MSSKIKYFVFIFISILWMGCEELSLEDIENNSYAYFEEAILVENPSENYKISDTIWVSGEVTASLVNLENAETIPLNNATFILSGELFLLYTKNDSVSFLEKNFSVQVTQGELELINVLEDDEVKLQVDLRYGKPLDDNKFRFALIPKFEGTFALKASSNVYYGENRNDFNDLSWENEKGIIYHYFENETINESAYGEVPVEVKQYFEYKFGSAFISEKNFYFFNVTTE